VAEIFIYLIPRKYRTIGHFLIALGGFFIIFIMIYMYDYINIIGQVCIIIGLSGIYFSKTKNFRIVGESVDNSRVEEKSLTGTEEKILPHNAIYIFYVITTVGIIFSSYFLILSFTWVLQGDSSFISFMLPYPIVLLVGELLLIGGLFILYSKKKRDYWYRVTNLPIKYRFAQFWKCRICGNKFRSKIMKCPNCGGENLKQRG
jgi:hypothetical protein